MATVCCAAVIRAGLALGPWFVLQDRIAGPLSIALGTPVTVTHFWSPHRRRREAVAGSRSPLFVTPDGAVERHLADLDRR